MHSRSHSRPHPHTHSRPMKPPKNCAYKPIRRHVGGVRGAEQREAATGRALYAVSLPYTPLRRPHPAVYALSPHQTPLRRPVTAPCDVTARCAPQQRRRTCILPPCAAVSPPHTAISRPCTAVLRPCVCAAISRSSAAFLRPVTAPRTVAARLSNGAGRAFYARAPPFHARTPLFCTPMSASPPPAMPPPCPAQITASCVVVAPCLP
ncbi:hypothetical protein DENSPDRAFT_885710 [Dentipellis sp. KUC8613]|nr:hypothetical protein DENSPDRAFT_885710 [Dentipellis sp. KUC8613]